MLIVYFCLFTLLLIYIAFHAPMMMRYAMIRFVFHAALLRHAATLLLALFFAMRLP